LLITGAEFCRGGGVDKVGGNPGLVKGGGAPAALRGGGGIPGLVKGGGGMPGLVKGGGGGMPGLVKGGGGAPGLVSGGGGMPALVIGGGKPPLVWRGAGVVVGAAGVDVALAEAMTGGGLRSNSMISVWETLMANCSGETPEALVISVFAPSASRVLAQSLYP